MQGSGNARHLTHRSRPGILQRMQSDADYISIESAVELLGVTPETIRDWVASGQVSSITGEHGRLVRRTDVLFVGTLAGNIPEYLEAELEPRAPAENSRDVVQDENTVIATERAREQLAAIRDEWLAPLIDQIREQAQEIGRLEERVRHQSATISEQSEVVSTWKQRAETAEQEQQRIRDQSDQIEHELDLANGRIRRLREALQQRQQPSRWRFWER